MTKTNHFHTSHWGTFTAEVEDGRLTGVQPFSKDTDPSPTSLPSPQRDDVSIAVLCADRSGSQPSPHDTRDAK